MKQERSALSLLFGSFEPPVRETLARFYHWTGWIVRMTGQAFDFARSPFPSLLAKLSILRSTRRLEHLPFHQLQQPRRLAFERSKVPEPLCL